MIRIIDNTLTAFDNNLPSKEDLHTFCELLLTIGVDMIELTIPVFEKMEYIPNQNNFILHIDYLDDRKKYPDFCRYICHIEENYDEVMNEIQINDAREIVKLRSLRNCKNLRIVGLDDLICESYDRTMKEILTLLPKSKINLCPENTYGCANALVMVWLQDFGSDVTTSFAGYKHNAATEEILMALRISIRHKPNRDLTVLPKLRAIFEKMTHHEIGNKKPIIGKNIFKVEAGIHADAISKNPSTYEAYAPECVGGKSELVIGKHSGMKAIKLKLEELDIPVPQDSIIERVLVLVKSTCTCNRKSLSDEEFQRLAVEVIAYERKQIYC